MPPDLGKDDGRDYCNTDEFGDGDRMFGENGCNLQCHPRPFSPCVASAPNGTAGSYGLGLLNIVRTNPLTERIVYVPVSKYRDVTHQCIDDAATVASLSPFPDRLKRTR